MADKIIYMRPGETLEIRHVTHADFEKNAKDWRAQARVQSDLIRVDGPHSITPATSMLECNHWKTWTTKKPVTPLDPMPSSRHHPVCSVQKGGSCDYDCARDYPQIASPPREPGPQVVDNQGEAE